MGLISAVVAWIAALITAILVAVLARLIADDAKAWSPRVASWIIQRATAALPTVHRERLSEEWQSHADQLPGDITKIIACLGFWIASRRILSELAEARSDFSDKLSWDIAKRFF